MEVPWGSEKQVFDLCINEGFGDLSLPFLPKISHTIYSSRKCIVQGKCHVKYGPKLGIVNENLPTQRAISINLLFRKRQRLIGLDAEFKNAQISSVHFVHDGSNSNFLLRMDSQAPIGQESITNVTFTSFN